MHREGYVHREAHELAAGAASASFIKRFAE